MNLSDLKGSYERRVKDKKDYAQETNNISKRLEIEEQQMLNKLQKTYQTERHMTDILNKVCDSSPVKMLKAQKQQSHMSQ